MINGYLSGRSTLTDWLFAIIRHIYLEFQKCWFLRKEKIPESIREKTSQTLNVSETN